MRLNLKQIGYTLAIAGELLAIAAEAAHRADRALEKNKVVGAIEVKSIREKDHA